MFWDVLSFFPGVFHFFSGWFMFERCSTLKLLFWICVFYIIGLTKRPFSVFRDPSSGIMFVIRLFARQLQAYLVARTSGDFV